MGGSLSTQIGLNVNVPNETTQQIQELVLEYQPIMCSNPDIQKILQHFVSLDFSYNPAPEPKVSSIKLNVDYTLKGNATFLFLQCTVPKFEANNLKVTGIIDLSDYDTTSYIQFITTGGKTPVNIKITGGQTYTFTNVEYDGVTGAKFEYKLEKPYTLDLICTYDGIRSNVYGGTVSTVITGTTLYGLPKNEQGILNHVQYYIMDYPTRNLYMALDVPTRNAVAYVLRSVLTASLAITVGGTDVAKTPIDLGKLTKVFRDILNSLCPALETKSEFGGPGESPCTKWWLLLAVVLLFYCLYTNPKARAAFGKVRFGGRR
jgi:hypothetical protein